jgi:hypothetical protein
MYGKWGYAGYMNLVVSSEKQRNVMQVKIMLWFLLGNLSRKHNGLMDGRFWIYCIMITNSTSFYCSGIGGTLMGHSASEGWENYHVADE